MDRYLVSMDHKINIVKMTILPKEIYRFNVIPSKIPSQEKKPKFLWNYKRSLMLYRS